MNTHPPVSDLEALVAGTLDEDRSILISAHTDDCAVCGRELSWLRAERELFAQRARGVPPSEVWAQIEARIESRLSEQLVKAKTPAGGLRRRLLLSFQRERAQWYAVGAAAAAIFGIVAISPLSPLRKSSDSPSPMEATSPPLPPLPAGGPLPPAMDPPDAPGDEDHITSSVKLSGPMAMEVTTSAAEVEVLAGPSDLAKVTVSDSSAKSVRWLTPSDAGSPYRLEYAGGATLHDGHLRLQVPTGTKLVIRTASGDVQVADLRGDLVIATASGDVNVRGARALQLNTTSGDMDLRDIQGPIEAKTTSGELRLGGEVVNPLRYTSVSGDLTLSGACRVAACQVTVETTSGGLHLVPNKEHSVSLRLRSQSGEINGTSGLTVEMKRTPGQPTQWATKLGAGAGTIDMQSVSGDMELEAH